MHVINRAVIENPYLMLCLLAKPRRTIIPPPPKLQRSGYVYDKVPGSIITSHRIVQYFEMFTIGGLCILS